MKGSVSDENESAAVEKRVKNFYVRYLTGLIAEPQFPKEAKDRQRMRRELTETFIGNLKELKEETGGDPLLCAQDFFANGSGDEGQAGMRG